MTDSSNNLEPWEPTAPQPANQPDPVPAGGKRLTRNKKLAIVGGAAAVIGLGAIAAPVVASTITGHDRDHDGRQEQFEKDLAAKLGVPQSKVDGALKAMKSDRLAQRLDQLQQSGALTADQVTAIKAKLSSGDVQGAMQEFRSAMMTTQLDALIKKGTITQQQADQVTALVKAGVPVGLRVPPPGATGDQQQPQHVESAAHQQEQVKQLQAAGIITADQATTINALITAKKTAEAETAIHAAMDVGLLTQLVKDGKVTQAQADQITALQQAGVPIGIGGPGMGGHHGDRGPDMDGDHHGPDMDGDHGMGGFDGPPPMDGQQGQGGGSQSGQFQPQSFDASNA
ncbi:MAG: hypothetical protein ACR2J9_13290 [Gaiellales bacterium]